jgi:hypothetical protein
MRRKFIVLIILDVFNNLLYSKFKGLAHAGKDFGSKNNNGIEQPTNDTTGN